MHQHSDTPNTSARWYAIHTKPLQEERTEQTLRAWRVETYAPRVWEGRLKLSARGRFFEAAVSALHLRLLRPGADVPQGDVSGVSAAWSLSGVGPLLSPMKSST